MPNESDEPRLLVVEDNDELARQMLQRLFRKVKTLTGLTAYELLRSYRLKRAARLLRSGVSVRETAYQVGFESPAYFSKLFREQYQTNPREFAGQD